MQKRNSLTHDQSIMLNSDFYTDILSTTFALYVNWSALVHFLEG